MELLIMALGEMIVTMMMAVILLVINATVAIISLVFFVLEACFCFFIGTRKAVALSSLQTNRAAESTTGVDSETETSPKKLPKKKTRIHNIAVWIGSICLSLLIIGLCIVAVLNAFFFESTTRFILRQVEARTKIAITFEKAEGNLWSGRLHLRNFTVSRKEHHVSCFDLAGKSLDLDISATSLLSQDVLIESLAVSSVHGSWEQVGRSDSLKSRRTFHITHLAFNDVQLEFTDKTRGKAPFHARLQLQHLESSPLRSDWAMFDLFFRSRGTGTVNGVLFTLNSKEGKHFFVMNDMPVDLLKYSMKGTFDWFETGRVDLKMDNRFEHDGIDVSLGMVFHDFHVEVPEDASLKIRAMTLPLVAFMNSKSERLPLELELQLQEDQFRLNSADDLNDFAQIVLGEKIMDQLKKLGDFLSKDNKGKK